MNVNYIQTPQELSRPLEQFINTPVLGIDSETSGYTTRVADMTLLQIATTPEDIHVLNVKKLTEAGQTWDWLYDILASEQVPVFMNAKFDLQFIQKLTGRRLQVRNLNDVMLSSNLLAFGDKAIRHSLAAIAERELGVYVDKSLQKSDFSGPEFSEAQIEYAASDAGLPLQIREKQGPKIQEEGLRRVARLEFDTVTTLAEMEYEGIYIEPTIWNDRITAQALRYDELEQEIFKMVGHLWPVQLLWGEPGLNLASPTQVLELIHLLGIKTEGTSDKELIQIQNKHPVIPLIREFRDVETAKKKFGEAYGRFLDPVTGRVHASFWQIEAPTGRMSARDPNLMQIPTGGQYRDAFRSQKPGGKMITADYSQIELRVMAKVSGDHALTQAFINDEDLHNKTTHLVLGEPLDNPDPKKRTIGKFLNFGTAYGTSAKTFAGLAGISERAAQIVLKDYWDVYCGLDAYMRKQAAISSRTGIMRTPSGRVCKLRMDLKDPKNRGRAERLGRNFSIQGTGADILKTALCKVRTAFIREGLDAFIVNSVHDEIVVEAPTEAERAREVLNEAMLEAAAEFLDPIPCKVDIRVKEHWSK